MQRQKLRCKGKSKIWQSFHFNFLFWEQVSCFNLITLNMITVATDDEKTATQHKVRKFFQMWKLSIQDSTPDMYCQVWNQDKMAKAPPPHGQAQQGVVGDWYHTSQPQSISNLKIKIIVKTWRLIDMQTKKKKRKLKPGALILKVFVYKLLIKIQCDPSNTKINVIKLTHELAIPELCRELGWV